VEGLEKELDSANKLTAHNKKNVKVKKIIFFISKIRCARRDFY
jgi:hypothetical protein